MQVLRAVVTSGSVTARGSIFALLGSNGVGKTSAHG
jgi:ABC-type branched-subunit amino acid transport system ATPase component